MWAAASCPGRPRRCQGWAPKVATVQGRHVSRGCWGFSGWVLWAWTVGFKGTLGLACEPRSAWCVRPMWLALGTLYVVRVVSWAWALGFALMHSFWFFVVVRFSGPLLLGRPAGLPGRHWVSVCGLPGALSGGRRGLVQFRVRVAACGALVN